MNPFFVVSKPIYSYNECMENTAKEVSKKVSKSKIEKIIWPFVYFAMVILLCVSGSIFFHNYYYTSIFVSGTSMQPTLNETYEGQALGNNLVEYGIVDSHKHAIDDLKRFNIITTYYPWTALDYKNGCYTPGMEPNGTNPCYKIKRVLGMPGDTIEIVKSHIIINGVDYHESLGNLPFKRKFEKSEAVYNTSGKIVLPEGRYWVQGDHWGGSTDCLEPSKSAGSNYDGLGIYYGNITGVLVAIEGVGKIVNVHHCNKCNKDYTDTTTCKSCGGSTVVKQTITDKVSIPKRYYL